jgi:hypothetical protein
MESGARESLRAPAGTGRFVPENEVQCNETLPPSIHRKDE